MSAATGVPGAPGTPGEAVEWARAVLQPGVAVVVGIAIPAGSTAASDVAVLDTDGRLRVHDLVDGPGGWALTVLGSVSRSRILLAYNAANVREWLMFDAVRGGLGIGDLADPEHWNCVMRARSAAVGRPDRLYPLGTVRGAVDVAGQALMVIEDIARHRYVPIGAR
jgi:hypothetical protein